MSVSVHGILIQDCTECFNCVVASVHVRFLFLQVFETFGPVKRPFYSIRINSVDDMSSVGVALGDTVYITPDDPSLTKYVFPQELLK